MPAGESDAQGIEEARHKEMQGAVLEGGTHQKQGVRGKQRDCKTSGSGSIAFVPGTAGLMIAGEVVRDLLKTAKNGG